MELRIARAVSAFDSARIRGGLMPNIYYLSKEEIKAGHETMIFTCGGGKAYEQFDGIPIYRTRRSRLSRFTLGPMLLRAIKRSGLAPDIIHSMNAMPLGWIHNPRAIEAIGARCVLSVHTPVIQNEPFSMSNRYLVNSEYALLLKRLARTVDLNIAVSSFVKRELVAAGVPETRVRIVPSGLRSDLFEASPFPDFAPEALNCLYVGRYARIKGLDTLIMAAKMLKDSGNVRARFNLVGGAPGDDDYHLVRRMVFGEGLQDTVTLTPPVDHQRIPDLYRSCDCFILPSRREPLGKVVLEAMSSRRLVIASRAAGIPDLVWNGKNGVLFDPDSPESLAKAITAVAFRKREAMKMASRGVGFSRRFDWRNISRRYVEAFESVL